MAGDTGISVRVQVDTGKALHPLSRNLFGGFVEHMYLCVEGGLWAEALMDRKMAGAVPEGKTLPPSWHSSGEGVSLDAPRRSDIPNNRARSVQLTGGSGIFQERISLQKGGYRGSLWVKGRGAARVRLLDSRGNSLAEARISPGEKWKRHSFRISCPRKVPEARFEIIHEGEGPLWVESPSLMPASARGGVHPGVLKAIRSLKLGYLRYPGGNFAQTYRWKDGIGPRDDRPARPNVAWQNLPEPDDFGTDEYLALCKALNVEPTVCVNVEGLEATPEEAAAWVAYCNDPKDTPMGRLRAENGHPEPYGVRCWEIGNEIYGDWEVGHSDAAAYARNCQVYARAMKAADPSIRLIAVGESPAWNRTVLEQAGRDIDILSLHRYVNRPDVADLLAESDMYEEFLRETLNLIAECVPGRKITLSINEWNTMMPDPTQWTLKAALFGAGLVNTFIRQGDLVEQACCSDLINGWTGGLIQRDRERLFLTPNAHVLSAYARTMGAVAFPAQSEGPSFRAPAFGKDFPAVDAAASGGADGKSVALWIVNRSPDRLQAAIEIKGWERIAGGEKWILTSRAPDDHNNHDRPEAILPQQEKWGAKPNPVECPLEPYSVTVLQLRR